MRGERRGWKNGERWEKMRETGDKGKKGGEGRKKGEEYPMSSPS
jgi:hypothetical protein